MNQNQADILTPSMRALQSMPYVHQQSYSARRDGNRWRATVSAGQEGFPPIRWLGRGDSKASALEDAANCALSYRRQWRGER